MYVHRFAFHITTPQFRTVGAAANKSEKCSRRYKHCAAIHIFMHIHLCLLANAYLFISALTYIHMYVYVHMLKHSHHYLNAASAIAKVLIGIMAPCRWNSSGYV